MLTATKTYKKPTTGKAVANNISKKSTGIDGFKRSGIQAKLTIGQPGDKYEQEADRIADRVMTMPEPGNIQRSCAGCATGNLQAKPLFQTITPFVQRQPSEEEEEQVQTKIIQKQEEDEPAFDKSAAEKEEPVMTKMNNNGPRMAASSIENSLNPSKGNGSPLPDSTRSFMENRFGADFSHVRVHNDSNSVQLNEQLNSKAFTRGRDIYFNSGKYNPESSSGKHLLAHELTHVIQQKGSEPDNHQGLKQGKGHFTGMNSRAGRIQRMPANNIIQMNCEEDRRRCRNNLNWSDGGHWIGVGPEPDCNCDNTFGDARDACRNNLNWSDGGHWIGDGPEPDCSLTETFERTLVIKYFFPSNECVRQFNDDRRAINTHISTMSGVLTSLLFVKYPPIAIIAGAIVSELSGRSQNTPIGVGYTWIRTLTVHYTRSAHPRGENSMLMSIDFTVLDENDERVTGYSTYHRISQDVARRIGPMYIEEPPLTRISINCPRGNVLSM